MKKNTILALFLLLLFCNEISAKRRYKVILPENYTGSVFILFNFKHLWHENEGSSFSKYSLKVSRDGVLFVKPSLKDFEKKLEKQEVDFVYENDTTHCISICLNRSLENDAFSCSSVVYNFEFTPFAKASFDNARLTPIILFPTVHFYVVPSILLKETAAYYRFESQKEKQIYVISQDIHMHYGSSTLSYPKKVIVYGLSPPRI